jgi:Ring finger domain
MTIPSKWCPTCDEVCQDHPTMCTICGTILVDPPQSLPARTGTTTSLSTPSVSLIPEALSHDVRRSGQELRMWLSSLNTRIAAIRNEQNVLRQQLEENVAMWQATPPTLWDPQSTPNLSSATSAAVLTSLPRTVYTSDSSFFQHCVLEINVLSSATKPEESASSNRKLSIPAVPGDFCKWPNANAGSTDWKDIKQSSHSTQRLMITNMAVVVADPPGTGETVSEATIQKIQNMIHQQRVHVLLYMTRGGGLTFVQKAAIAQQLGASVCVIGNHLPDGPWPYTMRDSTGEAEVVGLSIPTVMVSHQHGQVIQKLHSEGSQSTTTTGTIIVQPNEAECCICTESYSPGSMIIQIQPGCGHYFHETCAMTWLSQHNTCPFCRFELPFEDDERERYRLIQQRNQTSPNAVADYYG